MRHYTMLIVAKIGRNQCWKIVLIVDWLVPQRDVSSAVENNEILFGEACIDI